MITSISDIDIAFTLIFPLPFRVLALVGLGILGWATNLHILDIFGIDSVGALDLRSDSRAQLSLPAHRYGGFRQVANPSFLYNVIYRICAFYTAACFVSWAFFRLATASNPELVDLYAYIPGTTILIVLAVLICPFNVAFKVERDKFLFSLRRCLFSSAESPVYFSDVVFADVLTSFSKVLGDVWISLCMLLPGNSLLISPTEHGISKLILPTIMSLPFLVRLRQCIIEYSHPSNTSRRPLYNALKYATSFPVIFLASMQQGVVQELVSIEGEQVVERGWHGEHWLFRLWLLAAFINSFYSFWWDVTNDWGLDIFVSRSSEAASRDRSPPRPLILPQRHSATLPLLNRKSLEGHGSEDDQGSPGLPALKETPKQPSVAYGLRSTLLYPLPVYPFLVFINLVLRLTWLVKLSGHLHSKTDGSVASFWFEIAEVARRWLWVFIRVEWEIIRKARGRSSTYNADVASTSGDESETIPPDS